MRTRLLRVAAAVLLAACSTGPAAPATTPDASRDVAADVAVADGPGDGPGDPGADVPGVPRLVAHFVLGAAGAPPAVMEVPFPSDAYRTDPDGTLVDSLRGWRFGDYELRGQDTFSEGFAPLDGFGRTAGVIFPLDGDAEVDPGALPATGGASLAPGAAVLLLDVGDGPRAGTRVPVVAGASRLLRTLVVQPDGVVLDPGRAYAAVLTTGVRTTAGAALAPSDGFRAIRDDVPGARADPRARLYGAAVDRVIALAGLDRGAIAALTVYTTTDAARQLGALHDALVGGAYGPAPVVATTTEGCAPYKPARFGAHAHPGWTATLDDWLGPHPLQDAAHRDLPGLPDGTTPAGTGIAHDAIGAVLSGAFESPDFRRPGGTTSAARTAGTFAFDAAGRAVPQDAHARVPVTLVLPRAPAPAAGYPVVIYQHGLGEQRQVVLAVANTLARAGIATAAIDAPTFGSRGDPTDVTSFEPGPYRGPDGFADASGSLPVNFAGGFQNLLALRDNLRQSVMDLTGAARLVRNPALDLGFAAPEYGGVAPRLDAGSVGYVGNSLGGILGTLFASVAPEVGPVVLNVGGAGFIVAIAAEAPNLAPLVGTALTLVFGLPAGEPFDRFSPLGNLLQHVMDGGDAGLYAAGLLHPAAGRPHDVLITEALWDDIMSNRATEDLARAVGAQQVTPLGWPVAGLAAVASPVRGNGPGGATAVFQQLSPATHGGDLQTRRAERTFVHPWPVTTGGERYPHLATSFSIREPIDAYQAQIVRFVTTAWSGAGRAEVVTDGLAPRLDYDDDGFTDDQERAAGTDPNDPRSHP